MNLTGFLPILPLEHVKANREQMDVNVLLGCLSIDRDVPDCFTKISRAAEPNYIRQGVGIDLRYSHNVLLCKSVRL